MYHGFLFGESHSSHSSSSLLSFEGPWPIWEKSTFKFQRMFHFIDLFIYEILFSLFASVADFDI